MNSSRTIQRSSDLEVLAEKIAEFERIEKTLDEPEKAPSPEAIHKFKTCIAELEAAYDRKRSQQKEAVPPSLMLELAEYQLYLATVISRCPRLHQASYPKYPKNAFLAPIYHCDCALFYAMQLHWENPKTGPLIQAIFNCLSVAISTSVLTQHKIDHRNSVLTSYTGCDVMDEFFQDNRGPLFLFKDRLERGMSHFARAVTSDQLSGDQKYETIRATSLSLKFLKTMQFSGRLRFFMEHGREHGPGAVPLPIALDVKAKALSSKFFYPYDVADDEVIGDNNKYFHPPSPR